MPRLTEVLENPVLPWELKRIGRRQLWRILPIGYCAWLGVQAVALFGVTIAANPVAALDPHLRHELRREAHAQQTDFLQYYLDALLKLQLVLVIAVTPAFTAGSLGQEKERGTLFELFGTQLTSRQILLGKLLGRLVPTMALVFTSVPALVFIATYSGRGLTLVILALVQEVTLAVAVGVAGLLFGIWIRRSVDAIIALYLFLGLTYVIVRAVTVSRPEMFWFDPVENLRSLLTGGPRWMFWTHLGVWAVLGAVCLRLGEGRLRKACIEQRDRKPPRRLWAFRPPVGNDPIRWRECHVIGLAPLPILRLVPRWLGVLAIFAGSATVACACTELQAPGFVNALLRIDLGYALDALRTRSDRITGAVPPMGFIFILLGNLLVGVRCGTSVPEEKRRNTWDDLLLTAQTFREITTSKMWGILQATLPYIIAYALPVVLVASAAGAVSLLFVGILIVLPCVIVLCAALRGIDMVRVPPEMDETRPGGAFWFEKAHAPRRRHVPRRDPL
jgi:hypothetical protein